MALLSTLPVILTLLVLGPQAFPAVSASTCDPSIATTPVQKADGYSHIYKCLGYDGYDSFDINACGSSSYNSGPDWADIAIFSSAADFNTAIDELITNGALPEDNWANIAAVDKPNYIYLGYSNSTNDCIVYKGDTSKATQIERFTDDSCDSYTSTGYICDITVNYYGGLIASTTDESSSSTCGSWFYYGAGGDEAMCIDYYSSYSYTLADAQQYCSTQQTDSSVYGSFHSESSLSSAMIFFNIISTSLTGADIPLTSPEADPYTYKIQSRDGTYDCFYFIYAYNHSDGAYVGSVFGDVCTKPANAICTNAGSQPTTTTLPVVEYCSSWTAIGMDGYYYFCVDTQPVSSLPAMESACQVNDPNATYASASTSTAAEALFTEFAPTLPSFNFSSGDYIMPGEPYPDFKISDGADQCYYFINDVSLDATDLVSPLTPCDGPGRVLCKTSVSPTTAAPTAANSTTANTTSTTSTKVTTTTNTTATARSTPSNTATPPDTTGYQCASGTPKNYSTLTCTEGCFGLLHDGNSRIDCLSHLNLTNFGFDGVTGCGTAEKDGKCVHYNHGNGEVENCMRCCTSSSQCNTGYRQRCDYTVNDESCGSGSVEVASLIITAFSVCSSLIIY